MKARSTMHIPPELSSYVRDALQTGRSEDDVHSSLKSANWTETEIATALSGWMICDGAGPVTGYATTIIYQRIAPTEFTLCTEVEFPPAIQEYDLRVDANRVSLQRSIE